MALVEVHSKAHVIDEDLEVFGTFRLFKSDLADRFYEFDPVPSLEEKEEEFDTDAVDDADGHHPPVWLMTAILAGLYELPKQHILK